MEGGLAKKSDNEFIILGNLQVQKDKSEINADNTGYFNKNRQLSFFQ